MEDDPADLGPDSRARRLPRAAQPFREPRYRVLVASMTLSLFGAGMWIVAVAWQVIAQDGGPAELSIRRATRSRIRSPTPARPRPSTRTDRGDPPQAAPLSADRRRDRGRALPKPVRPRSSLESRRRLPSPRRR